MVIVPNINDKLMTFSLSHHVLLKLHLNSLGLYNQLYYHFDVVIQSRFLFDASAITNKKLKVIQVCLIFFHYNVC